MKLLATWTLVAVSAPCEPANLEKRYGNVPNMAKPGEPQWPIAPAGEPEYPLWPEPCWPGKYSGMCWWDDWHDEGFNPDFQPTCAELGLVVGFESTNYIPGGVCRDDNDAPDENSWRWMYNCEGGCGSFSYDGRRDPAKAPARKA